tara:strand:- start:369 stop:815 length:447 start_codon:yes stop_codon:yes gene_type:complete
MDDIFDTVMTSFLAQMESSLKISKIVSEHGGESELSEDSIVSGLVYRLMTPMSEEELSRSIAAGKNIYEDMLNVESEEEGSEEEEEIEEIDMNSLELRKVKTNNCNCDICMGVRVSLLNYKNHEPKDNLELMFKNAIDKACEKGKLYI